MATITATGNYPSSGERVNGPFWFECMNGSSITATLQFLTADGSTWADIPDDNSYESISGGTLRKVEAYPGMKVRINVSAVSGTWNYAFHEYDV